MTDPLVLTTTVSAALSLVTQDGQTMFVDPQPASTLIEALGPTFVFRPGGVAGGNVYTTWTTLMAAVALIEGPKFIELDASLATANVDPGAWNVDQCTFYAQSAEGTALNFPDNGSAWTFQLLYLQSNVELVSASSTPIVTVPNGASALVFVTEAAILATGAAAFFVVQNGGACILEGVATLGDGTHSALDVLAGGSAAAVFYGGSDVQANALSGAVATILSITSDVTVGTPQAKTPTVILLSAAVKVAYTPGNPANWNPAPAVIGGDDGSVNGGAVDQLVTPNTSNNVNGAPISPFTELSISANLTRKRAGLFRVSAVLSGTDTTTERVAVTLVRDETTVIGPTLHLVSAPQPQEGGVPAFGGSITWTDIITDTAAHSWSVHAVGAGGGTLSVDAAGVGIEAVEQ